MSEQQVMTVPRGEVVQKVDDLTAEFRVGKDMVMITEHE